MNECDLRCGIPFGLPTFFLDFIGVRKKNIRKKLRMSGKEYISQRGKNVPEKVVKLVDCNNCKYYFKGI
jgi:hypothetical protein